jgi:MoaA/NifB/PqqE/SkfB family radical SAM enzyme
MSAFNQSPRQVGLTPSNPSFWNRFPMLVNGIIYRLLSQREGKLNTEKSGLKSLMPYEPLHLHYFVPRNIEAKRVFWHGRIGSALTVPYQPFNLDINPDSFQFLLDQVPTIQTLEFSGWGDPLVHINVLVQLINQAYAFTGIKSHIYTPGYTVQASSLEQLLHSKLQKLSIVINGHKPSAFAINTLEPADQFMERLKPVKKLIQKKSTLKTPDKQAGLCIELVFIVDNINYTDMPDIIAFSESLGVQAVRFENYIEDDNRYFSLKSLYEDNQTAIRFINNMKQQPSTLAIHWPKPLLRTGHVNRSCQDPFSVVSFDSKMRVSPCSQNQFLPNEEDLIWESSFWNHPSYTHLRSIYQNPDLEIPAVCQNCPRNLD